jgi:hypothetical protein
MIKPAAAQTAPTIPLLKLDYSLHFAMQDVGLQNSMQQPLDNCLQVLYTGNISKISSSQPSLEP